MYAYAVTAAQFPSSFTIYNRFEVVSSVLGRIVVKSGRSLQLVRFNKAPVFVAVVFTGVVVVIIKLPRNAFGGFFAKRLPLSIKDKRVLVVRRHHVPFYKKLRQCIVLLSFLVCYQ